MLDLLVRFCSCMLQSPSRRVVLHHHVLDSVQVMKYLVSCLGYPSVEPFPLLHIRMCPFCWCHLYTDISWYAHCVGYSTLSCVHNHADVFTGVESGTSQAGQLKEEEDIAQHAHNRTIAQEQPRANPLKQKRCRALQISEESAQEVDVYSLQSPGLVLLDHALVSPNQHALLMRDILDMPCQLCDVLDMPCQLCDILDMLHVDNRCACVWEAGIADVRMPGELSAFCHYVCLL